MAANILSEYVLCNGRQPLLKRWACSLFLYHGMFENLVQGNQFARSNTQFLWRLLGIGSKELGDEETLFITLSDILNAQQEAQYDESDPFCINTRWIQTAMGLSETELGLLRFYLIASANHGIKEALNFHNEDFHEATLCDFLASFLYLPADEVHAALAPEGPLKRSGLLRLPFSHSLSRNLDDWIDVEPFLMDRVFRRHKDPEQILNVIYTAGGAADLALSDYQHLGPSLSVIDNYLNKSIAEGKKGINILLWGEPGTGKTELARALNAATGSRALEVPCFDEAGTPLSEAERIARYGLGQYMFGRSGNSVFVFDEVEGILCDVSYALHGIQGNDRPIGKAALNALLEHNRVPAIWISNTISGIDPAYLRRFDFCLQVELPKGHAAMRLASELLRDVPIGRCLLKQISEHPNITPAALEKAGQIYTTLGDSGGNANIVVSQIINSDLQARGVRGDKLLDPTPSVVTTPPYCLEYLNGDCDIEALTGSLSTTSDARLCLYGPPGTGKTAWARHLAERLGKPLLIKRASDILDAFLGGTERKIANAFKEAEQQNALLLIDEADSFLQRRDRARYHWEVSQVNEFLTRMEEYQGLLVCTTNLMDNLDAATLRRFDFKIRLDYLQLDQAVNLASRQLSDFNSPFNAIDVRRLREGLSSLAVTPGDFAMLERRYRVTSTVPTPSRLLTDLSRECAFRSSAQSRPIGFTAKLQRQTSA